MLHIHIAIGPLVLLDLTAFEVVDEPAVVEDDDGDDQLALPFGFVMADRADPAPDPVFRDLDGDE